MNKLERQRIYSKRHRDKLKAENRQRKMCNCGLSIRRDYMARHKRTNKHKILTYTDPKYLIVCFK